LLNGPNSAAVRRPAGAGEVLQFANAELVGTRTYQLSRFLRGQMGSEWAMADPLPAGAPFVLLDPQIVTIARGVETLGHPMQLRIIAAGRSYGDPAAVAPTATAQPTALNPLAPVRLAAARDGSGVTFSWVRRKRGPMPASWDVSVPLGEVSESYEVDILSGTTVVRTLHASASSILYFTADDIADYGAAQSSLAVRVYQISTTVGRGFPASATLTP
jgi:hypothetical protein